MTSIFGSSTIRTYSTEPILDSVYLNNNKTTSITDGNTNDINITAQEGSINLSASDNIDLETPSFTLKRGVIDYLVVNEFDATFNNQDILQSLSYNKEFNTLSITGKNSILIDNMKTESFDNVCYYGVKNELKFKNSPYWCSMYDTYTPQYIKLKIIGEYQPLDFTLNLFKNDNSISSTSITTSVPSMLKNKLPQPSLVYYRDNFITTLKNLRGGEDYIAGSGSGSITSPFNDTNGFRLLDTNPNIVLSQSSNNQDLIPANQQQWTVSLWYKPLQDASMRIRFFDGVDVANYGFQIDLNGTENARFIFNQDYDAFFSGGANGPASQLVSSNFSNNKDDWSHIALVRDYDKLSFYQNKHLIQQFTLNSQTIESFNGKTHIDIQHQQTGEIHFYGFNIWDVALDDTDLMMLYKVENSYDNNDFLNGNIHKGYDYVCPITADTFIRGDLLRAELVCNTAEDTDKPYKQYFKVSGEFY